MKRSALRRSTGEARMSVLPQKSCRYCRAIFTPRSTMQTLCRPKCATDEARDKERAERAKDKTRKEAAKPRSKWIAEAQAECNKYIRLRDADKPCISCNRHHNGQWHAGHYLTTGARPELRFNTANIHKQCQPCNTHLHGNLILYRVNLIERIGLAAVEWLEGPHEPMKLTVDDIKAIRDLFKRKQKLLSNAASDTAPLSQPEQLTT